MHKAPDLSPSLSGGLSPAPASLSGLIFCRSSPCFPQPSLLHASFTICPLPSLVSGPLDLQLPPPDTHLPDLFARCNFTPYLTHQIQSHCIKEAFHAPSTPAWGLSPIKRPHRHLHGLFFFLRDPHSICNDSITAFPSQPLFCSLHSQGWTQCLPYIYRSPINIRGQIKASVNEYRG